MSKTIKEPAKLPLVTDISPWLGCDPEFFFKSNGEVIGAEKVIPKEGLLNLHTENTGTIKPGSSTSKFIIDGVQAELNPRPNTCRANLGNEIICCMKTLKAELKKQGNGLTADFSRAVEISKDNLMQLDESSRKFGCAPSKNVNRSSGGLKINKVDPMEYRIRAAGGHIHIGTYDSTSAYYSGLERALKTDYKRTVMMLDIICGNTSVLIDRDPANIERRKVYGKAGEYRLPNHGLEYRTLSNYWMTAYPLMSLAFGLARFAVILMSDKANHELFFKEFTSVVKAKNIKNAINNNDFDLAMENFKAIEPLMLQAAYAGSDRNPINKHNIEEFHYFVDKIKTNGLGYWFKKDPMTHWTTLGECHTGGFYDFSRNAVRKDMNKQKEIMILPEAPKV